MCGFWGVDSSQWICSKAASGESVAAEEGYAELRTHDLKLITELAILFQNTAEELRGLVTREKLDGVRSRAPLGEEERFAFEWWVHVLLQSDKEVNPQLALGASAWGPNQAYKYMHANTMQGYYDDTLQKKMVASWDMDGLMQVTRAAPPMEELREGSSPDGRDWDHLFDAAMSFE